MVRKQKWEKEYEEYDKLAEAKKINEVSLKFDDKTITKEELKWFNEAVAKFRNVEKVANIIEYKKQLEARREKINKEIEEVKKYQKSEENIKKSIENNEKLEKELNDIQNSLSDVSKKLQAKDLTEDKRTKLEDERKKLISKKDLNNKKYAENQAKISKKPEGKKLKDLKELEDEKENLGIKIGKCCFVGRMLMAGKSWQYIEVKYEQNKKYTDKDNSLTSKVDNQRNKGKEEKNTENESVDKTLEKIGKEVEKEVERINNDEIQEEKVALVEQTKFQKKHPRLAKFFASVKNFFNKNKKVNDAEIDAFKKVVEEVSDNKEEKIEEKSQRDEFLDYLKVVSEKGIDQVKKDSAKQRLTENKKVAYTRETEKFGKDYAEMSYKESEEQGRE